MSRPIFRLLWIFLAVMPLYALDSSRHMNRAILPESFARARGAQELNALQLRFEPNLGQTDEQVKFLARGAGYTLFLTSSEAVLKLSGNPQSENNNSQFTGAGKDPTILRMSLVGTNRRAKVVGEQLLPGKSNYFIGNDPLKWRTAVPNYARVACRSVYTGVNLVYYGSAGALEYDFVVAPGADPAAIKLTFNGTQGLKLDGNGDLLLQTRTGEIRQHEPRVYQLKHGRQISVACQYRIKSKTGIGFEVGAFDRNLPLTIDPVLVYSGSVGGSGADSAYAIAVDSRGSTYVAGTTSSLDFPTKDPYQAANAGVSDAFVINLNASGTAVEYSTYFGGSGMDVAYGLAISGGVAWITGYTTSKDFPLFTSTGPNMYKQAYAGGRDAFVVGLNSGGGDRLLYSSCLGGPGDDFGTAITTDPSSNVIYVTGAAGSGFPTTKGALGTSLPGGSGAFVAKFFDTGALLYSTYLAGSSGRERGAAITADAGGNAYVAGVTASADFPTVGAFQPGPGSPNCRPGPDGSPCYDAFVSKLNSNGTALLWSTYLGGSSDDVASGIALDPKGNIMVTGFTLSTDFPVFNALQPRNAGGWDGFATRLSPSGRQLISSTYLGGSGDDFIAKLALRVSGAAVLVGDTHSNDFPLVNPIQGKNAGGSDVFLAELSTQGDKLAYSTYLGGLGDDYGSAVATDQFDNVYLTGRTTSSDFPEAGIAPPFHGGSGPHAYAMRVTPDDASLPSLPLRTVVTSNGWPIRYTAFNDSGTVVFAGGTGGPSGGLADGIVFVDSNRFQKFVKVNDPVPGVPGGIFTGFGEGPLSSFSGLALNNRNDVAFQGVFGSSTSGIFMFSGGNILKVAATGDPTPDGAQIFGGFGRFLLNDSGMLLFEASPTGQAVTSLYLYKANGVTSVDSTGLHQTGSVVLFDNQGNASIYYPDNSSSSISVNRSGKVTPIVNAQDGTPWGGPFSGIFDLAANSRGDVVFRAHFGPKITDQGLFVLWNDGRIERIVAEGEATPLGGTYHLFEQQVSRGYTFYVDVPAYPALNNVPTLVFTTPITGASVQNGTFVLEQGKISVLVNPGTPVPGDPAGSFSSYLYTYHTYQLTDQDLVLFRAPTRTAYTPDSLFLRQENRIVRVASLNDRVPGTDRDYLFPRLNGQTLNASGDVMIDASVCCESDVEGLFVASPPHPDVPNGDFEVAGANGLPSGWGTVWLNAGQGNASLYEVGASSASSGKKVLRLHLEPGGGALFVLSDSVPVNAGQPYLLSAQMRYSLANPSDIATIAVIQYDAAGNTLGFDEIKGVQGRSQGSWGPFAVLFQTRPDAASIRIRFSLQAASSADLDVDAVH